jgi:MarR family transcriptional regulator for hemolysin
MFLWEQDDRSQAELSRLVAIEPPTMLRTLERMVRDGLVTRESDPRDRRLIRIRLTARGAGLQSKLVPEAQATNRQLTAALSEAEVRRLRELLQRLLVTLQAEPGAGPTRRRRRA